MNYFDKNDHNRGFRFKIPIKILKKPNLAKGKIVDKSFILE